MLLCDDHAGPFANAAGPAQATAENEHLRMLEKECHRIIQGVQPSAKKKTSSSVSGKPEDKAINGKQIMTPHFQNNAEEEEADFLVSHQSNSVSHADGSSMSDCSVRLPLPSDSQQLKNLRSSLKNVLLAYSRYDPTIKFDSSQNAGMGLIVTVILYHTQGDEVSSFWILVSLIENYDMRQFY
jgi:hypothetical protein